MIRSILCCLVVAGCVESQSVVCDDGLVCPQNQLCAPAGGCVEPQQLSACEDRLEGEACTLFGIGDGTCRLGVCVVSGCGDGIRDLAEACDDGNEVNDDACTNTCALPTCGDGIQQPAEACDTGAANADDRACTSRCLTAACGDGLLQIGVEQCDAGASNSDGDVCTTECKRNVCGDARQWLGVEPCDDGNTSSGDGCRGDCRRVEVCNGEEIDANEGCDDGNANPVDACDACGDTTWTISVAAGASSLATTVGLAQPRGVAVDAIGNVYVADTNAHRIRRIDAATGAVTTVAGSGEPGLSGDGGPATSAQLDTPNAIAVDGLGNLFIADTNNHRVRRVEASNRIITTLPATANTLLFPAGVAVDGQGNVFVADTNRHVIKRIDAITGNVTIVAGVLSQSGDGADGIATSQRLSNPNGLAIDSAGALYIADRNNHRIRRVINGFVVSIAGNGTNNFSGDNAASELSALSTPTGVAVAGSVVYIADRGNSRVRRIAGGVITTVAGTVGNPGYSGDGGLATTHTLSLPSSVSVGPGGAVFVADQGNNRVRRIDGSTQFITTLAGTGSTIAIDGGAATAAVLEQPQTVAMDGAGNLYVCNPTSSRIQRVSPSGTITHVAGTGAFGGAGDGGPAKLAQITYVYGLAVDGAGNVYLADTYNHRIRKIDSATGIITTIAGTTLGFSGDNGPATSAQLASPGSLAFDTAGNLYIADTGNGRIRRVTPTGTITTVAGNGTFGYTGDGADAKLAAIAPHAIAVDASTNIYIADTTNHVVRRVAASDGTISTIAGTGAAGFDDDASRAATTALLNAPTAIAVDGTSLLIADTENHRVRRVSGGMITTLAGVDTGGPFFDGDGGAPSLATLYQPKGIAVSGQSIVVADTGNNRVRRLGTTVTTLAGKIDPEGMGPRAIAFLADARALVVGPTFELVAGGSTGTVQRVDDNAVAVVGGRYPQSTVIADRVRYRGALFGSVNGIAYDATAKVIYVTESNRVHAIDASNADQKLWTIAELAGTTTAGFVDGLATSAMFRSPTGLYLDEVAHVLYVADTGNHVIRQINLTTTQVTTIAGMAAQPGSLGDGGAATSARMYRPQAITRCNTGELFVADTGNHRVRRIASGVITTVLGDGTPSSAGQGAPSASFPVDTPLGVACDGLGNVFVTSTTTIRLLPATDALVVDGTGPVETIYGAMRTTFPQAVSSCLAGVAIVEQATSGATMRIHVTDVCAGLLVELQRQRIAP